MTNFTKKHLAVAVGVVLAVVVAAFLLGRRTAPVQTKEVTKTVEVQKQTTLVQQKVDIDELKQLLTQYAQNVQKNVDVKRVIVYQKDGTKTITEETVDKSKSDTEKSTVATDDAKTEKTTAATQTTETTKTVVQTVEKLTLQRPNWILGLQGGVSVPGLFGGDSGHNYLPYIPQQTSLGLTIDRRLLGGVYGGAWLNTRGEAGLGLRLVF